MSVLTREVSWSDGLVVAAFRHPHGLRGAVESIQAELGPQIGSRNTFAKLLRGVDPRELSARDLFRAWLLLVALREQPLAWGVPDTAVPPGYDVERLRRILPWAPWGSNPEPAD